MYSYLTKIPFLPQDFSGFLEMFLHASLNNFALLDRSIVAGVIIYASFSDQYADEGDGHL